MLFRSRSTELEFSGTAAAIERQQGEVRRGAELLAGLAVSAAIADTAYDAEHFHDTLRQAGRGPSSSPGPTAASSLRSAKAPAA